MPTKKDDSGRRSVEIEFELPGTPEQIWDAIATGPGITSWFVPSEVEPYAGGKVARYYVAESAQGRVVLRVNPQLGRPEHHEFRWLTLDAAYALLPPRLRTMLAWARTVVSA